jgi:thioesterase domain-containing protein
VADGYLGNPELTESRFIKKAETRYYKTGDLVVQLPDQNLVFLNRMDKQIKLNGVRIEPEGIESVMMSYPGVEQVSVLLISSANHKSLAAFYVSKTLIAADALIAYLKQHLPSYAIPSAFCHLEKLPLTLNGKVDRKRLIEKFSSTIEHNESVYEPASTAAEEILLGIWQKCLPSSSFGVKQKFFELGGHSLLAMQLVLEINRLFNANFSVSWVFRNQTIKDQAAEISQSHQSHPVITFNRGPAETLFFFSPYTSSAMVYKALSGHLKAELSFSVIESMTLLEQDNATISIEALASRCIAYIKGQQAHGPYSLGGWSFGGVLAYEVARQLIQDGEVVSAVFLIDSHLIDSNSFKDKSMDPSEILFNRMPVSILNRLEQLEKAAANKLVALFKCGAGMMASYKPGLLQTKLVLIKAIKNSSDNVYSIKSDNGWKAHASDLNIIELDADHYQIIEPPCAEQVAEVINKQLQGG